MFKGENPLQLAPHGSSIQPWERRLAGVGGGEGNTDSQAACGKRRGPEGGLKAEQETESRAHPGGSHLYEEVACVWGRGGGDCSSRAAVTPGNLGLGERHGAGATLTLPVFVG